MPKFGRKTIKNAVNVTEIFLKVKRHIDENGNPTEKAEGMIAVDSNDNLIILRPGAKKFDRIMKQNVRLIQFISHLPHLKEMTTEEIRDKLIYLKLLKDD